MPQFRVEYGDSVIPDGFFLRRGALPEPGACYADGNGALFRHLSTFPDRSTIKESVLDLLNGAKRHVLFCNFLLQDEEVIQALLTAAKRLHGHVYILTTLKADDFVQGGETGDDVDGDFESHIRCVKQLTQQGLLVKARSDCHAKFMTIDDTEAIVTSANAVPTCYGNVAKSGGGVRGANPENGVLVHIPSEVNRLANFFRAIWRSGCNYYVSPDSSIFEVQQIKSGILPVNPLEPAHPAGEGEILWTAPGDLRLLGRILGMVREARDRLSLSTWVIKGMDAHELGETLRLAAARGVNCQIVVRGMNWREDHRRQCYLLARSLGSQLTILGDYWNHSKAVVADHEEALVLTGNLDAQHGLDHGVEIGFCSREASFVAAVTAFLERLANDAAFEFVADPTQATVADRYGRHHGQRLEGPIRVRFQATPTNIDLVRRWCDAARKELVRVSSRQSRGREELVLLTNDMAIFGIATGQGDITAHAVRDRLPAEDLKRFDGYLGRGTVICDVAGERR